MQRNVKVCHLLDARSGPLLRHVLSNPASAWPEHLCLAWTILKKRGMADQQALPLITASIGIAVSCGQAINRGWAHFIEAELRERLSRAFTRLNKCCRRAPAGLRQRLDGIVTAILQGPIDAESIESMLDAVASEFEQSVTEAAATALRAMLAPESGSTPKNWIKTDYSGLRPRTQRICEEALSGLGRKKTATQAFTALAAALTTAPVAKPATATLRADYVAGLARLWQAAGLYPGRGHHGADPSYTSDFHRYAELILTAVAEPWVARHSNAIGEMRARSNIARARLAAEYRRNVAVFQQSTAVRWLISEDILRRGLCRQRVQKSTR